MENSKELIGILQAISIVAKNLAEKLMRIDREIKEYESCQTGMPGKRKKAERKVRIWEKGKKFLSAALSVGMWKGTAQRRLGTAGELMKKGIFPLLPICCFRSF